MSDLFDYDDPHAEAVERRLRELRQDPEELLRRFDRNGDGVLDAEEWRAVRDVVRREVEDVVDIGSSEVIADRYRLVAPIGRGAQGNTHLAEDQKTGEFVAVKEVDFAGLQNWDPVETFEREVAVLGGLDHPAIPRVLDSFRIEEDGVVRLFLVQTFIEGTNLDVLYEEGRLFPEEKLVQYAAELVDVLEHLHGHSPPVLHRDVKPANIIERPDGSLALVDFGAAQGHDAASHIIGTNGYMPAEQLLGRATLSSDLYGLGATLIHLATRRHPSELSDGWSLDWRRYAKLSEPFADWLDQCVAPTPDDRFPSAIVAGKALARAVSAGALEVTQDDRHLIWTERFDGRPSGDGPEVHRKDDRIQIIPKPAITPFRISMFLIALGMVFLTMFELGTKRPEYLIGFVACCMIGMITGGLGRAMARIEGDPRKLMLVRSSETQDAHVASKTRLLRLEELDGPVLLFGGHLLQFRMKSGRHHGVMLYINTNRARWLRDEIHLWLLERRLAPKPLDSDAGEPTALLADRPGDDEQAGSAVEDDERVVTAGTALAPGRAEADREAVAALARDLIDSSPDRFPVRVERDTVLIKVATDDSIVARAVVAWAFAIVYVGFMLFRPSPMFAFEFLVPIFLAASPLLEKLKNPVQKIGVGPAGLILWRKRDDEPITMPRHHVLETRMTAGRHHYRVAVRTLNHGSIRLARSINQDAMQWLQNAVEFALDRQREIGQRMIADAQSSDSASESS